MFYDLKRTVVLCNWKFFVTQTTVFPSGEREVRNQGNKHLLHLSTAPGICNSTPVQLKLSIPDELVGPANTLSCHTRSRFGYYQQNKMDNRQLPDKVEPNKGQEEEEKGLDWLLGRDSSEIIPAPMDTNISISR